MIARITGIVRGAYGSYGLLLAAMLLMLARSTVSADITSNLLLHNTFDADASDSSSNNYDGTLTNGASIDTTVSTNKIGGGKLRLDGSNDYVDLSAHVGAFQNVSEGTIVAWVYADANATGVIFEASDSGDDTSRIVLIRDAGALIFAIHDEPTDFIEVETAAGLIPLNTWTHVAVTVDNSGNKLYINGTQVTSGLTYFEGSSSTNRFFDHVSNLDFMAWGVNKESGSQFNLRFDGFIDDSRVYDRALSASNIMELYSSAGNTLVVDTTSDISDGDTSSIANLIASMGADGFISLREAIEATNNTANIDGNTPDEIHFNISGLGPHTIAPSSALPNITDAVMIDGTMEPDYMSTPVIELDGSMAGLTDGLRLAAGSGGSTIRALAINRFSDDGIEIASGAEGNTLVRNFIGTDVTGTLTGFGNGGAGIHVASDLNTIGGSGADQNLISGNTTNGINVNGGSQNMIAGNWIGVDVTGTLALGNGGDGIQLSTGADTNQIGAPVSGLGNVISANGGYGIRVVTGSASDNVITSNLIGLNAAGTSTLTNTDDGIYISGAPNTTIGGLTANARNVIAAPSGKAGIDISGTLATGTVVQGNYIGTDINGATRLSAGSFGISAFDVANTTIGGTASGAGNVIAGYSVTGLHLSSNLSGSIIRGNFIGTDTSGTLDLTTGFYGIGLQNGISNVAIGGTTSGAGNVIAFHSQNGIKVWSTAGTALAINQNQIFANGQLGIELDSTGVTNNDMGDGDTGPNNLQNFPVLGSAHTTGTIAAISGTLNSIASTTFRLEFFANATADGSGHGEGERYLGFREVTTHATTGNASFTFMLSAAVAAGEFVTATATNLSTNDTSEFALNVTAVAGLDSDGDGVLDIAEDRNLDTDDDPTTGAPLDTDGDSTLDYLDTDDDGDGTPTASEDPNGNGDPTDDDTDGDGIPDYLDPDDAGPGAGDSDSDGVDDDAECPSHPPCTDTDGDGIPNYNDPDHNTLVKRLTLDATADTEGVWIEWSTGWEVDTLGFQVYREVSGERVQVTPSLIAGSALLAGPGTILPAGHSYAWHDPAGTAQDRYWLVDVDLSGSRTWHGPLQAHPVDTFTPSPRQTASPLLAQLGQRPMRPRPSRVSPPRGRADATPLTWVTTPSPPPAWERPDLSPVAVQHALAAAPALILTLREPGWYRVPQADLMQVGLDPQIDPRHLQLFADGYPQPLHVVGEDDGSFDPGDAIEFYGDGLDTPWTDTQAYWLVVGSQPGTRLQQVEAPGQSPTPESFAFTVEQQERTVYIAAIQNGDEENFFGAVIGADPVDQVLHLTHLDPAPPGEAQLVVTVHGVTVQTHPVTVRLNDHEVGTVTVSGRTPASGEFPVPQSWLQPGINLVTLSGTGAEGDVSVVESLALTYWRTYTAEDDVLRSTVPSPQSVSMRGFTTDTIRVFDITDPETVEELVGPVTAASEGYRITVAAPRPGARTLLAIGDTQSRSPLALTANVASTWHSPDQGADLVIIAHATWLESARPLKTLREQQGWSVALIDVQDLYDEWTFGNKDPQAISAFLQHAGAHWQTAPRFVLLVGDASFDPRDYLGQGPSDWIPTTWVRTAEMETASDDALADLDGDGIADLALGRLPVRSAEEADTVVAKLLAYDAAAGDWRGRTLVVTDRPGEFDFAGATQPLVQYLSAATAVTRLSVGSTPLAEARQHLDAHLEAGQLLVTYLGHGSVERWHPEGLLTTSAVYGLANGPRLPLVLSMTCLNGFFHDLYTESVAEAFIRAPQGGAVAVWASSGLTRPTGQTEMQQALVARLLSDDRPTLGEAIRAAKALSTDADVRRTWILLGDPTLRLTPNAMETSTSPGVPPLRTNTGSSSSGGGCALSPGTTVDPILLGVLGLIGVYFGWKHESDYTKVPKPPLHCR